MDRMIMIARALFAPIAALIEAIRTAPSCGGDCAAGRRPCNCRLASAFAKAPNIGKGLARCIACGEPQGKPHVAGCWVADVTIGRAR